MSSDTVEISSETKWEEPCSHYYLSLLWNNCEIEGITFFPHKSLLFSSSVWMLDDGLASWNTFRVAGALDLKILIDLTWEPDPSDPLHSLIYPTSITSLSLFLSLSRFWSYCGQFNELNFVLVMFHQNVIPSSRNKPHPSYRCFRV